MNNTEGMKSLAKLLNPGRVLLEGEVIDRLAQVAGTTPEAIERILATDMCLPLNGNFGAPLPGK